MRTFLLVLVGYTLLSSPLAAEGHKKHLSRNNSRHILEKVSSQQPQPFLRATKKARQSVVSIHTLSKLSMELWERFGAGFLSPVAQTNEEIYKRGSGFVISEDGYIITNNHVIDKAETIIVQFLNGKEYQATVIGRDPTTDIALIKIETANLIPLSLADSSTVEVGEWVIAIGNPFGLQASVSSGIISGDGRSYPGGLLVQEFFQTDASINPGNSGGPLINLDGDVVGMNTSALTAGGGGCIGIGFSIPSNLIKEVLKDIRSGQKPQRGYLGMLLFPIYMSTTQSLGSSKPQGIFVAAVDPASSAGKAGFLPGDFIVELEGYPIQEVGQLRTAIALSKPGKKLSVVVKREAMRLPFSVIVEESQEPSPEALKLEQEFHLRVHPTIVQSTNKPSTQVNGLLVSEIDTKGPAFGKGLRAGHIILSANGRSVSSAEELAEELFKKSFFHLVTLRVLEDGTSRYLVFFY